MERVLAINPGSTSTKLAVYDDEKRIVETVVRHSKEETDRYACVLDQRGMRKQCILDMLAEHGIPLSGVTAVVGRGGLINPIDSGTYRVNEQMLRDLEHASGAVHASALGGMLAYELGEENHIPAYVVDPVVVDEMEPYAKLSGIPGIERRSVFHALNSKAVARRAAESLGVEYTGGRFIVAHMGGGITVSAHWYGRVIDVNDAISGEGPFTPERCGAVPLIDVVDMCFSGEYTRGEVAAYVERGGGLTAYLGTNDLREVERMIKVGDEFAALVVDSMAYQVCKEIGAMFAVLEGRVDAVVLTGGLAHSDRFTAVIKQKIDPIARIIVMPGEDEMRALVEGVLRVLRGAEAEKIYE